MLAALKCIRGGGVCPAAACGKLFRELGANQRVLKHNCTPLVHQKVINTAKALPAGNNWNFFYTSYPSDLRALFVSHPATPLLLLCAVSKLSTPPFVKQQLSCVPSCSTFCQCYAMLRTPIAVAQFNWGKENITSFQHKCHFTADSKLTPVGLN